MYHVAGVVMQMMSGSPVIGWRKGHLQAVGFCNDQLVKSDPVLALRHNCEQPVCQKAVQILETEILLRAAGDLLTSLDESILR